MRKDSEIIKELVDQGYTQVEARLEVAHFNVNNVEDLHIEELDCEKI